MLRPYVNPCGGTAQLRAGAGLAPFTSSHNMIASSPKSAGCAYVKNLPADSGIIRRDTLSST